MKGKRRGKGKSFNRNNSSKNMRRDEEILGTEKHELRSDERKFDARSRDNDPSWYAQSPQIIRDFASLPFGNPLGSKLPQNVAALGSGSIAGIMTLYYTPTIGVTTNENSAINVAMRNIYSYVRHANSGHSNYDGPDLMLYLLAMDSVYMFHAWCKRLYGQLMLATTYNRYYPKALIESERVDYDDLQSNIADFRGFINLFAVKMGSMAVPNSMSYMARHTWMTEGLYVDDPSTPKAQTYKYVPGAFLQFTLDEQGAGSLKQTGMVYNAVGGLIDLRGFSDIVNLGNSLLNPILANEDMNIMSGDILKAFGDAGIVKSSGITEDYMVLPSYSQEVLSQMENATIYHGMLGINVTQTTAVGTGYLVSTPIAPISNLDVLGPKGYQGSGDVSAAVTSKMVQVYQGARILNMHMQDVTPEQVMVATRLTNTIVKNPSLTGAYVNEYVLTRAEIASCGSEICNGAAMWNFIYGANGTVSLNDTPIATTAMYTIPVNLTGDNAAMYTNWNMITPIAQLTQFDWHPLVYPMFVVVSQQCEPTMVLNVENLIGDIANYTEITEDNIANMNDIALLSEFSVPQAGLF